MRDNGVIVVCGVLLGAGVVTTLTTGAWQPAALGACVCWLGAEYITSRAHRARR